MTIEDIEKEVNKILDDKELKQELGITKHDKQNFKRLRSVPKMLELLFKANKLKLIDEPTSETPDK